MGHFSGCGVEVGRKRVKNERARLLRKDGWAGRLQVNDAVSWRSWTENS